MRISLLLTGLLLAGILTACADEKAPSLEKYQNKKRIILTYPSDAKVWGVQLKDMRRHHLKITERDVVILQVNGNLQSYTKAQRAALMKQYNLTPGTHVLIGKDGGEKSRQSGELDLEKWFKLIDTMPMRKAEMKP